MVGRRLKPTESQELPTKKATKNPILSDRFIIFYYVRMKIGQLERYFLYFFFFIQNKNILS